jgi:hypothetical protein
MNAIPSAALAITNAFTRFDRASEKLLAATSGASNDDPAQAIVEQIEAKAQLRAGLATVRIADEMLKALLEMKRS